MYSKIKDTLLLVGDSNSARIDLRKLFQESFNLLEAENIQQAVLLLKQNGDNILLCLVDVPSPTKQDVDALMAVALTGTAHEIPIVTFIDPQAEQEREERAFMMGAADVIRKPYSLVSIQKRIRILIDLFMHKWDLERIVSGQKQLLKKASQRMVDCLSSIIEHRSAESGNHVLRIRRFTKILLEEVARCCPEYELSAEDIDAIASASVLHDIGKISIPDTILNKPGRLTKEEFNIMKGHALAGSRMIEQMADIGDKSFLQQAYNICRYHHERWDGKGYPNGLCGDDIPICAQVVGLADAFDALISERVYKQAFSPQDAINMILHGQCGVFSPKLLECFKHVCNQLVEFGRLYADGYSPKQESFPAPALASKHLQGEFSTLELSNAKYRALLHYINDTVMEVDMTTNTYHIVYNPDPDTELILSNTTFDQILDTLNRRGVHPEDLGVIEDAKHFVQNILFQQDVRRRSFFFRFFDSDRNIYQKYELILLNVRTSNEENRFFTAIWHRINGQESLPVPVDEDLRFSPALRGMIGSILRCRTNKGMTIDSGMTDLTLLTGYTSKEIESLFDRQLWEMIHEEDREEVSVMLERSAASGSIEKMEFRLKSKSGPIWVLAKGRTYLESDRQEYYYLDIQNNDQSMRARQKLLSELSRDKFLLEQSGSIVFDWDLSSDTLFCSPKWVEHFGYMPVSKSYSAQLGIATHFHPDDLAIIRLAIEDLMDGADPITMEVRIANIEGKYLWTKITAAGQKDDSGKIVRILGILQDINDLKQAAILLKNEAERDSLTKLLNKTSTQALVNEYLDVRAPGSMAGLMIIDLDNFKQINDRLGHMYGDSVLIRVSSFLRSFFRHHDIIGRVGGDEFIVVICDLPNKKLLEERSNALQKKLGDLLEELAPGLQVSCSIGVAIVPEHGTSYNQLFNRADKALYLAKAQGKNQLQVYSSLNRYNNQVEGSNSTRIDSDNPDSVSRESFERFVFHSLYESTDLDTTINELLAMVGKHFGVSRAYVFENNHDNTTCSNTFEWCNEGITPEKDNLQNISYIDDIPGWPDLYNENNVIYCTDISQMDARYRAVLEPQGIKSLLHCAIVDHGVFRGYVGFDECDENKYWTKEQISQLSFMAEALAVFLLRERNRAKE